MRGLMVAAIAGLLMVATVCGAAPTMAFTKLGDTEHLTVSFDKGAVGACTVYQEQKVREDMREYFPDGKYAPRHCWMLDGTETGYQDDWAWILPNTPPTKWLVRAEVQYVVPGQTEFSTVSSNAVEVTR